MKAFAGPFFLIVSVLSSACNTGVNVTAVGKPKAPEIESIDRVQATAGESILLTGKNLDMELVATVGTAQAQIVTLNESQATLVLPSNLELKSDGTFQLAFFHKSKIVASFPLIEPSYLEKLAVSDVTPDKVCAWAVYKTKAGEAMRGSAGCPKKRPICSVDGQKDCITNVDLQAYSKIDLVKNVMKGKIAGGVAGTAESCQIK